MIWSRNNIPDLESRNPVPGNSSISAQADQVGFCTPMVPKNFCGGHLKFQEMSKSLIKQKI